MLDEILGRERTRAVYEVLPQFTDLCTSSQSLQVHSNTLSGNCYHAMANDGVESEHALLLNMARKGHGLIDWAGPEAKLIFERMRVAWSTVATEERVQRVDGGSDQWDRDFWLELNPAVDDGLVLARDGADGDTSKFARCSLKYPCQSLFAGHIRLASPFWMRFETTRRGTVAFVSFAFCLVVRGRCLTAELDFLYPSLLSELLNLVKTLCC